LKNNLNWYIIIYFTGSTNVLLVPWSNSQIGSVPAACTVHIFSSLSV
jgi:hypothetical protein